MGIEVTGVVGLLVLVLDLWAIINTLSAPTTVGSKLIWILLIILLPVIGVILWFFLGPRARKV